MFGPQGRGNKSSNNECYSIFELFWNELLIVALLLFLFVTLCFVYLLRPCLVSKKIAQYPSHRIFGHMHEALNVVEKITNYTV